MKLIDADALIERLKKDPLFGLVEQYGITGVIEAEPAIDAVTVVMKKGEPMRLIDADALIPLIQEEKIVGKVLDIIKALGDGLQAETLNQACDRHIKIISSLPTIDAVPVVRCIDCRYNYGNAEGREYNPNDIVCTYFDTDGMDARDYCSHGERRNK